VPTILEVAGIPAPKMLNGIAQKPIEGVSLAYTFDKANAKVPRGFASAGLVAKSLHGLSSRPTCRLVE
jgi:arylsulfatase A-like enzyme